MSPTVFLVSYLEVQTTVREGVPKRSIIFSFTLRNPVALNFNFLTNIIPLFGIVAKLKLVI